MTAASDAGRAPRLLPGLASPGPLLTLAIALISLLASLDITAASVAARTAGRLAGRLTGSATVVAAGRDLEGADAAAARAAETLGRAPGVTEVRVLDPAPEDALAARLLGLAAGPSESAPPRLIAVRFAPGAAMTPARAEALLRRDGLAAAVDDHDPLSGPIERLGLAAAGAMGLGLLALLALLVALTGAAIRRAARRRRDRLGLLVQLGAGPRVLAPPFRVRAVASATVGVGLGSGAAAAAAAILAFEPTAAIRLAARLPALPALTGADVALGLLWAPLAVILAAAVGQSAARAALRPLS